MDKQTVYAFIYNEMYYESAPKTMSIHKTKKGAYLAMRKFLIDRYWEWFKRHKKCYHGFWRDQCKAPDSEYWTVIEMKLED